MLYVIIIIIVLKR